MRYISESGLNLIKHFEGFSPKVYLDAAGLPTIGYGHLIKTGEVFTTLDLEEAEILLKEDVAIAERAVSKLVHVPLTANQFDALVSFSFNLGSGALQRSSLRQKLNRGEYMSAAFEFPRWVWAGGKKLPGLVRRRHAELAHYLNH